MIERVEIKRIKGNESESVEDFVVVETPLTLVINDNELATLLCSPSDIKELIIGFLFTSGLIKTKKEIKKIIIDQERWSAHIDLARADSDLIFKRMYTSGCGKGVVFYNAFDRANRVKVNSDFRIDSRKINALMADFQKKSRIYLQTGGAHSAALADDKGIMIFKEDIGRHNTIDKVIGQALIEKVNFRNKIMITSGRISSEVLLKAQKCRIPVIISKSAPTDQAVKLARDMAITLVGFARGGRMNVYSGQVRIKII